MTLRWTLLPLPTTQKDISKTPFQRYGHTAVEYENNAYIWGGRNDSVGACNTLFRFNGGENLLTLINYNYMKLSVA